MIENRFRKAKKNSLSKGLCITFFDNILILKFIPFLFDLMQSFLVVNEIMLEIIVFRSEILLHELNCFERRFEINWIWRCIKHQTNWKHVSIFIQMCHKKLALIALISWIRINLEIHIMALASFLKDKY